MSNVKNGDYVINYWDDEGHINIGKVSGLEGDEHDIEFIDGGSVSPVETKDSVVISESLARILSQCLNAVPMNSEGEFLIPGNIDASAF
jgi:hypothetical protein